MRSKKPSTLASPQGIMRRTRAFLRAGGLTWTLGPGHAQTVVRPTQSPAEGNAFLTNDLTPTLPSATISRRSSAALPTPYLIDKPSTPTHHRLRIDSLSTLEHYTITAGLKPEERVGWRFTYHRAGHWYTTRGRPYVRQIAICRRLSTFTRAAKFHHLFAVQPEAIEGFQLSICFTQERAKRQSPLMNATIDNATDLQDRRSLSVRIKVVE